MKHLILVAIMFILIASFAFGGTNQALANTLDKELSSSATLGDDDEFYLLTPQYIDLRSVYSVPIPDQTIFFRRNRASWSVATRGTSDSSLGSSSPITIVSSGTFGAPLPDNATPSDLIDFITFHVDTPIGEGSPAIIIQSNNKSLTVDIHYKFVGEAYDPLNVTPHTNQLTFYFNNGVKPNSQPLQIITATSNPITWSASTSGGLTLSKTSGQVSYTPSTPPSITQVSIDTHSFQSLGIHTAYLYLDYSTANSTTNTVEVTVIVSKDILNAGESLTLGQYLLSQDGQYKLKMQVDGNLVLYRTSDNFVMWASGTNGQGANQCVMQADGNLVIYNQGGQPLWASVTDGNAGAFLKLENDGRFIVYKSTTNFTPIWSTSRLCSGRTLQPGRILRSGNGQYKLEMQTDGNLVLRNSTDVIQWATNTYNNPGSRLEMRTDGNLVIFNTNNQVIWSSNTATLLITNNNGSTLRVQDDGNLVIYRPNNTAIWNRTQGRLY